MFMVIPSCMTAREFKQLCRLQHWLWMHGSELPWLDEINR